MQKFFVLKVLKSYGKKGDILAKLLIEDINLLKKYRKLYFSYKGEERSLKLKEIRRRGGKSYIVKFENIDSKEKAESLKGFKFYLKTEEFLEEDKDEYLEEIVIGFDVFDEKLGNIGKVEDVEKSQFLKRLHIRSKGGSLFLIPWVEQYVKKIDKKNKRIITDSKDLIDLQK